MIKNKLHILLLPLLLCIGMIAQSQVYQNYNQYGGRWKRSITDSLQGLPSDTIRPRASEEGLPHIAIKDDVIYVWSPSQLQWIPVSGGSLSNERTQLISGGEVTPLGGYDFFVNAALYRIDNIIYVSDTATHTLSPEDDDSSRIDKFYLADDGESHVFEGDLAPPASVLEPQLNGDQIELAFVTIAAGVGPVITTQVVYDENIGESTVTNSGTTTDPNNATNIYQGTKSLNVTNINDPVGAADQIFFDKPGISYWNLLGFDGITGFINLKAALEGNAQLRIQLFRGTTAVSAEVIISLNRTLTGTYQPFTISATALNVTNTDVNRVRIRYTRAGNTATHSGFYLDNMFFVDGVVQAPPSAISLTLNVPASMSIAPTNTIQNGGTWTLSFNGTSDQYISGAGVATTFPDIPNKVGLIQGRTPNANRGMTIDADSIFLDSVSSTNYGLATPDMYDKVYNYIVQQYYIQNIGNGDTLVIPINDTVTGIKSIVFDDHYGVTDSTIHIDTTAASGATPGLQDVITEDNQLTGANTIDLNTGSLEIESTAYPSGLIKAGNNGIVALGDAEEDVNGTNIEIDDGAQTVFIRGDAGVTIASPVRLNNLAGAGVRVVTADAEGDLSTTTISGSQTLQEVFDTEAGGSLLTKHDTILMNTKNLVLKTSGNAKTVLTGDQLDIYDNSSNVIASFTPSNAQIVTVVGAQQSSLYIIPNLATSLASENASFTGAFSIIKDSDSDSMHAVIDAQYLNINGLPIEHATDTTLYKPLVTFGGFLVKQAWWSDFPGGSGGGGGGSYTNEEAQDAVGAMINATLQYVDGTPLLSIADRDWGPFTSSSNGTVFDIDNLAIVNADINDVAWSKITGAPTTLSGYGITDALSNSTTSTQDGYFSTIKLKDVTNPSHYLTVRNNEDLTAARTFNIITGDADRTLTLAGNATISGTNTGDQTSVTGNAGTATALQIARNIQGVSFDGTSDINPINGTGFVKATGTTISYDNSTYLTTASAASTYQPLDADLTTIAGLTATTNNFIISSSSAWASRTPTQATALLDVFTTSLKGLVPSPGSSTGKYLKDDGTWDSPAGGGITQEQSEDYTGAMFAADNGDIDFTYNDGTPDVAAQIKSGVIVNADINASAAIDATKINTGVVSNTEFNHLDGVTSALQTQLDAKQDYNGQKRIIWAAPSTSNALATVGTNNYTSSGTITTPVPTSTNLLTSVRRTSLSTGTTAGTTARVSNTNYEMWRGNAAGLGGFKCIFRWGLNTTQTGNRVFVGLVSSTTALTNVDHFTNTAIDRVGCYIDANSGNWYLIHNTSGSAATSIDLGSNFDVNTTDLLELILEAAPNASTISYTVNNLSTGNTTSGTLSSNLPTATNWLAQHTWCNNNAQSAAVIVEFVKMYAEINY